MNYHIMTLFPDMVMAGLSDSIIGKAMEKDLISIEAHDIRDYTLNKHKKVDDYPYGGGAGMLMQAQPVYDCYKAIEEKIGRKPRVLFMTPQGRTFNQAFAEELAHESDLVFLCGHYEGIDERVLEEIVTDEVSLGDFVLTGGEMAAMVMVDCISRLVPGVLNNEDSAVSESFAGNLLEYPQYSRPEEWMGKRVPDVLLSGNHKDVDKWRLEKAIERTKIKRPDMYEKYLHEQEIVEMLMKDKVLNMDMIQSIKFAEKRLIYDEGGIVALSDSRHKMLLVHVSADGDLPSFVKYLEKAGYLEGVAMVVRGEGYELLSEYGFIKDFEYKEAVYTRGVALNVGMEFPRKKDIADKINYRLQKGMIPYFLYPAKDLGMEATYMELQLRISKKNLAFYSHP